VIHNSSTLNLLAAGKALYLIRLRTSGKKRNGGWASRFARYRDDSARTVEPTIFRGKRADLMSRIWSFATRLQMILRSYRYQRDREMIQWIPAYTG
jgi:hypothetical protein